ncbi:MAG: phosphate ABC transporter substrate-binding protein, PhoT family [Rhodanobacteraceae bacterium]|nr:MAG: phosphate ABC transporter substrate-binding protein, PhoT family [Rhodanobacteraceae bacterium]
MRRGGVRGVRSRQCPVGWLAALVLGVVVTGTATAASPATVEWQLPAAVSHPPQTDAQKLAGRLHGRPLPQREFLQPKLDAKLSTFVPAKVVELKGRFAVAASDILPGLVRGWIHAFRKFYPNVQISFGSPFEGSLAAKHLNQGKVGIAFVSRELKPSYVAAFTHNHGYPPVSVPVSGGSYRHFGFLDAVVFFVNQKNPIDRLSLAQLDSVLSQPAMGERGDATTWGQLGATGAWAKQPIHVYGIKPWNGFEEFVRERVVDAGDVRRHWRKDMHFDPMVFPIAKRVAADPDGIGYAGLAFVDEPVKIISIGHDGHYVAPTYANVASAAYPLSRLIYANVNLKPGTRLPKGEEEFLRFILSRQGQQIVLDQGVFLPLRSFQASQAGKLIVPGPRGATR